MNSPSTPRVMAQEFTSVENLFIIITVHSVHCVRVNNNYVFFFNNYVNYPPAAAMIRCTTCKSYTLLISHRGPLLNIN